MRPRNARAKVAPVRAAGRVPDPALWRGKRVLITGHTGAKGAMMAEMLLAMGAEVYGFGLPPRSESTHHRNESTHRLLGHDRRLAGNRYHSITDRRGLRRTMMEIKPDVVFHLAAIAAVEENAARPKRAIKVNAEGTGNVISAIHAAGVKAAVIVTTDKVYAATDQNEPLTEEAPLATRVGHPYALSKAGAAQRIIEYRTKHKDHGVVVDVRAGNIIGGDFTPSRLVPKTIQALENGTPLGINPKARRPWLHVYDAVSGYLLAGEEAIKGNRDVDGAINFAGHPEEAFTVKKMVKEVGRRWGGPRVQTEKSAAEQTKSSPWVLDTSKAQHVLGWRPMPLDDALDASVDWYRTARGPKSTTRVTQRQIHQYLGLDQEKDRKKTTKKKAKRQTKTKRTN
jgi:CDP-glucose 4,6-dehydratase